MDKSSQEGSVVVVEDDDALRATIVELLALDGLQAVAVARGEDALPAVRACRPGAAVIDVRLPGASGYEVCRAIRSEFADSIGILFLSGERTEALDRVAGLLIGADDYLVKPFAPDELRARVRSLLRRGVATARTGSDLTPRELEVLGLLAQGLDQHEIAGRLVISGRTVSTHIERVLRKLDVHSRSQAVAVAYQRRLVDNPA